MCWFLVISLEHFRWFVYLFTNRCNISFHACLVCCFQVDNNICFPFIEAICVSLFVLSLPFANMICVNHFAFFSSSAVYSAFLEWCAVCWYISLALCARHVRMLQRVNCLYSTMVCCECTRSVWFWRRAYRVWQKSTCYSVNHFCAPSHIDKNEAYLSRAWTVIWFHRFWFEPFQLFGHYLFKKTGQNFIITCLIIGTRFFFKPISWTGPLNITPNIKMMCVIFSCAFEIGPNSFPFKLGFFGIRNIGIKAIMNKRPTHTEQSPYRPTFNNSRLTIETQIIEMFGSEILLIYYSWSTPNLLQIELHGCVGMM